MASVRTEPEIHNTQFWEAMARYNFVRPYLKGGTLLDAGCAYGYGAHHLAGLVRRAIGVDSGRDALVWAKAHYRERNLSFAVSELTDLSFAEGSFDAVCFFETIVMIKDLISLMVWAIAKISGIRAPQEMGYGAFVISKEAGNSGGMLAVCRKA